MRIRAAVIVVNYGPYHIARARALSSRNDLEPIFLELADTVNSHPWKCSAQKTSFEVRTLCRKPFEECSFYELWRALKRALEDIDPEVVITTSFRPFIMLKAAHWACSRGKPTIFFYETTPWDKSRNWPTEVLKRLVLARYYKAAFVGGTAHRSYLLQLGMPTGVIWEPYDVVDNEYFAGIANRVRSNPAQWRKLLELPERYFLYVGRFSPEKNLFRLLEAYRRYRRQSSDPWNLVIVGEGPDRVRLEQAISNGGRDGVVLRSFQQMEMLPAFYALARCFILPSTVDPWGLVVNEAMACGLPVLVSSLCGSAFDLLQEGKNGFRFDPYDIPSLAELLDRVSSMGQSASEQMSAHSRQIVAAFTPEVWAQRLAECIAFVMNGQ